MENKEKLSEEDYQSKLSKQEYWEQNFELELKNFEETGDDGEVWFGQDVQKKTINYIMKNFTAESDPQVLDVGTGNGALLFKLAKKGYKSLKGIDYSEYSIRFAKKIQETDGDLFGTIDFEFQNAFDKVDQGKYDIIHDKGTFDVVYMNKELDNQAYAEAIRFRLKEKTGRFIITSCNCTSTELDAIFEKEGLFKKVEEIKGYKQFTYGGVTGQVVSTNVYQSWE